MAKTKFPSLAVILLIMAITWMFSDLGYVDMDLPWVPIIVAIIAIGMIFNRFNE